VSLIHTHTAPPGRVAGRFPPCAATFPNKMTTKKTKMIPEHCVFNSPGISKRIKRREKGTAQGAPASCKRTSQGGGAAFLRQTWRARLPGHARWARRWCVVRPLLPGRLVPGLAKALCACAQARGHAACLPTWHAGALPAFP
jgi:hypothetical protein